ncbi:MAG: hypothetical protein KAG14_01260 [Mycoplasmataceae bacterium]|nr:hypothetical protein [Mycoplasmataceae bacterium]
MKKLIIVAIALFTLNLSAAESPVKPNELLRTDIVQLLGVDCPAELTNKTCSIDVIFTINSKSEVIVLSVNAPNEDTEEFIKRKLNYKKVSYKTIKEGELFLLPLKFQKS